MVVLKINKKERIKLNTSLFYYFLFLLFFFSFDGEEKLKEKSLPSFVLKETYILILMVD